MSNTITTAPSAPVVLPARPPAVPADTSGAAKADSHTPPMPGAKAVVQEPQKPSFDAAQAQEQLDEAVERMNEHMRKNSYNLAFSVDKEVDKVVVKVTNLATGDVVRQIPNETALRIAHNIEDMRGLLQDKKI